MSATSKVFENYELTENILLYLPQRDLLLAQRISKAVRSVIKTSPNTQRALFLKPADSGTITYFESEEPSGSAWKVSRESDKNEHPILNHLLAPHIITAHYLAFDKVSVLPHQHNQGCTHALYSYYPCLPDAQRRRKLEAIARPEASWRSMLITQPPPLRLEVEYDDEEPSLDLEASGGVTAGLFVEALYARWRSDVREIHCICHYKWVIFGSDEWTRVTERGESDMEELTGWDVLQHITGSVLLHTDRGVYCTRGAYHP